MAKQVFYDPKQARWKRIRRVFDAAALALTFLVIFFIYTALRSEPLRFVSEGGKASLSCSERKREKQAREHRRLRPWRAPDAAFIPAKRLRRSS